jgi:hypothetical protein
MNDLIAFLLGFVSNFITSALFLAFLRKIKPQIFISDSIAKGKSSENKVEYMFKIINLTRRDVIDVKAELFLIKPFQVDGGYIREFCRLSLITTSLMEIKGINNQQKSFTDYDFCFKTRENLESLWKKGQFLLFRVQVTDSVSGFKRVFSREFSSLGDIKEGEFEIGKSKVVKKLVHNSRR